MTIRYFGGNWTKDLIQWAKRQAPEKIPETAKPPKRNMSCECGHEQSNSKIEFCWKCDTFTTEHYFLVNANKGK